MSEKELNIGDYCRDEKGNIDKLIDIREITEHIEVGGATTMTYTERYFEQDKIKASIIKSSPNIIDLIEVGDYVNGYPVAEIYIPTNEKLGKIIRFACENVSGYEYEAEELCEAFGGKIKTIVTKEQFESMEYKVGE